ncbi:MAG: Chaperone protein DnaK, partial [Planctomycetota bacterium]
DKIGTSFDSIESWGVERLAMAAKFAIGIDLGTTNSVIAYAPLDEAKAEIRTVPIPQFVAPGQVELLSGLPSFLYLPTDEQWESGVWKADGQSYEKLVIGAYARQISAENPDRTIAAAKSWLCHSRVDRRSGLLPWNSTEPVTKLSPIEASKFLLMHLIDSWHRLHPDHRIADQLIVLTVPASFDMAARELTREAAIAAGLPENFILLEEPQAALYHWLNSRSEQWRRTVRKDDVIFVCDIGGGTTDLTLVKVEEDNGELFLKRIAVGNHLLVGGDNMDLALAHELSTKFATQGTKLNPWQSISLWHSCRKAKETLLSAGGQDPQTIAVLGRGSRLIGGTVQTEISRAEAERVLLDGFFPACPIDSQPTRQLQSGFQEIGLPYESDTGITRHIASFLNANATSSDICPTHLLFNGGVFKSTAFRERLVQVMNSWSNSDAPSLKLLADLEDLDQAVACGAAYYAWSKRHGGIRIRGGTARSYYVGIESAGLAVPGMPRPLQALCVVPFGMEEGTATDVPGREVGLVVGKTVSFRFFASASRKEDRVGNLLRYWDEEELIETSPLELVLHADLVPDEGFIPVRFHSKITELGVFELWCHSVRDDQRWKLEFNVREDSEVGSP